jgi:hypothetical protein
LVTVGSNTVSIILIIILITNILITNIVIILIIIILIIILILTNIVIIIIILITIILILILTTITIVILGGSVTILLFAAFLACPLWLYLAKRWGKFNAWIFWSFTFAATNLSLVIPQKGDVYTCLVVAAINGIPVSAKFLNDALLVSARA